MWDTVDGRNHAPVGSLSHYSQGFRHTRWCRNSSINSMTHGFRGKLVKPFKRHKSNMGCIYKSCTRNEECPLGQEQLWQLFTGYSYSSYLSMTALVSCKFKGCTCLPSRIGHTGAHPLTMFLVVIPQWKDVILNCMFISNCPENLSSKHTLKSQHRALLVSRLWLCSVEFTCFVFTLLCRADHEQFDLHMVFPTAWQ